MDRRVLLFILLSTVIFIFWSTLSRGPKRPPTPATAPSEREAEPGAIAPAPLSESTESPAPTSAVPTDSPGADRLRRAAVEIRNSPATTVISKGVYEIEIAHETASLRAWRLLDYTMRQPGGRLGKQPVDLISVYSPDYAGIRVNGATLDWTPVGDVPSRILLSGPEDTASISFRTQVGEIEITKTFYVHGTAVKRVEEGAHDAWLGYAVDVEMTFRNLGENSSDAFAGGYELRWGPGIAADRERYSPRDMGAIGGLLSTTEVVSLNTIRDRDLDTPGPQGKDGDADDEEDRRTIWAAMHSKYFVAALLDGNLGPSRDLNRQVRFSEYDALPLPWPREMARYRLLLDIGKPWLTDAQHLGQRRTQRTLIFPTGTTKINVDLARVAQNATDEKGRKKAERRFRQIYADYSSVADLLSGARLEVSGFYLDPGQSLTDRFRLYAGPKHTGLLSDVLLPDDKTPAHLNETIRLGVTAPLAKGLLWLLKLFHRVLRNYGVAVVLLTLLVRGAMFPITQKSSQSMKRMQSRMKVIQPEIDEMKRKFRDDPQKMNAEMLKIYRKYGINPASQVSGCLMMLVQMPIFIAMYRMLQNAAELRGAPFFGWINDLTAPDLLFSVGGFPIRILPLVVTGGQYLQQRFNPTSGTMAGSQKTMMNFMPLFFLFIFYGMASGLNLYWGISTLLGVGQQYLVNRFGTTNEEENLTAADLERMAKRERKKKRRRSPLPRM